MPAKRPPAKRRPPIRVLVVDDHRVYAEAIAVALRQLPDLDVQVASARDDAVAATERQRPDVILLDLDAHGHGSPELVRRIRDVLPETKVIVLSAREEDVLKARAVEAGAVGFISKFTPFAGVPELIRLAQQGDSLIEREEVTRLLRVLRHRRQQEATERQRANRLTPRQVEILQLMADGMSPPEISQHLGLSPYTLRTHVQNILTRLAVHTKLEAVAVAIRHGKISARV